MYCPSGISPMGNLGCFPWGKPAATESHYPTYYACWVFSSVHNPPNSGMDYRIFNMRTDVNAWDCTQGCTDTHIRVFTESWLGEKSLAVPGNRTYVSSVMVRCPNQLSYINKSQHRKLALENKILQPLLLGMKPPTSCWQVWCSTKWATPTPWL